MQVGNLRKPKYRHESFAQYSLEEEGASS
jgi:hypothetical protein